MRIHEMTRAECLRVLARARLARLACAREDQPYIVPVYLGYDEASACLYGFTTPGQKVEWMRGNPLVCVEVDEIAAYDQWVSVIVFGRYEELPETPQSDDVRLRASERPRPVGETMPPWSSEGSHHRCDDVGHGRKWERAWHVLKNNPMWAEPGYAAWAARSNCGSDVPFISVFYRIRIDSVTGHEATQDARDAVPVAGPPSPTGRWGWLGRRLRRVFGGESSAELAPAMRNKRDTKT